MTGKAPVSTLAISMEKGIPIVRLKEKIRPREPRAKSRARLGEHQPLDGRHGEGGSGSAEDREEDVGTLHQRLVIHQTENVDNRHLEGGEDSRHDHTENDKRYPAPLQVLPLP